MKKQNPLESQIQGRILKFLNGLDGCKARNRHSGGWTGQGEPDIYGSYRGVHFEFEVKQPGNKPTIAQWQRMQEWIQTGAIAAVVTSVEEVQTIVEKIGQATHAWVPTTYLSASECKPR